MARVVIIGGGKGGRALLEMFMGGPTVTLLGVADINPWAPGMELARRLNIPITTDYRDLVTDPRAELIIDVTGSPEVHRSIWRLQPDAAEGMGGMSAKFMWDLLEERRRVEELEDRYSLMARELASRAGAEFIIGENPKMREIAELIAWVPPSPSAASMRAQAPPGKKCRRTETHKYSHLR